MKSTQSLRIMQLTTLEVHDVTCCVRDNAEDTESSVAASRDACKLSAS